MMFPIHIVDIRLIDFGRLGAKTHFFKAQIKSQINNNNNNRCHLKNKVNVLKLRSLFAFLHVSLYIHKYKS